MVNIRLVGSSKDELEQAMDNLTKATGGAVQWASRARMGRKGDYLVYGVVLAQPIQPIDQAKAQNQANQSDD
ncbi:hypothetical protein [Herpetosiphon gulosus]|uniref:Uncharacterized protein n=1 Tax=Herpetosiphon gulosus TaxID=1973496 RepID=A0ABP9X7V1_9CHLR